MTAIYNEIDKRAAAWLRELISDGRITEGIVNERSIAELTATDVAGARRVHLFAGIGGWDYALKLAGWPDDRPVWTGSCPCQPFSAAGKRKGHSDERHLWPEMLRLIKSVRPPCVFGEQVAGAIKPGWLDGVFADLEAEGYSCGAVVLGAHSAGAPHIRQRIYWVAHTAASRLERAGQGAGVDGKRTSENAQRGLSVGQSAVGGEIGWMANTECGSAERRRHDISGSAGAAEGAARERQRVWPESGAGGQSGWMADADSAGFQQLRRPGAITEKHGSPQLNGAWSDWEPIGFRDGKTRRIEPGLGPLADGIPGRVGLLRGYGNAIVPQVAAVFIRAFLEAEGG